MITTIISIACVSFGLLACYWNYKANSWEKRCRECSRKAYLLEAEYVEIIARANTWMAVSDRWSKVARDAQKDLLGWKRLANLAKDDLDKSVATLKSSIKQTDKVLKMLHVERLQSWQPYLTAAFQHFGIENYVCCATEKGMTIKAGNDVLFEVDMKLFWKDPNAAIRKLKQKVEG